MVQAVCSAAGTKAGPHTVPHRNIDVFDSSLNARDIATFDALDTATRGGRDPDRDTTLSASQLQTGADLIACRANWSKALRCGKLIRRRRPDADILSTP